MPKTYTSENFDSAALKGYRRETADLIAGAIALGWEAVESKQGFTLRPWDKQGGPIHLSKRPRSNSGPLRQHWTKVVRHADPLKVAAFDGNFKSNVSLTELTGEARKPEQPYDLLSTFKTAIVDFPSPELLEAALREQHASGVEFQYPEAQIADARKRAYRLLEEQKTQEAEVVKPTPKPGPPKSAPVPTPPKSKPPQNIAPPRAPGVKLVSERPYLSHLRKGSTASPGKVYESKVVLQQDWSDGSITYRCMLCSNTYTSPHSVTSHHKSHVRAGEAEKLGPLAQHNVTLVDDPHYTEPVGALRPRDEVDPEPVDYNPREDRVDALAQRLMQLLQKAGEGRDGKPLDATEISRELAREALTWVHSQQGNGVPHEPKTAEEVLEAVRTLVDRGEYRKLRDDAEAAERLADEQRRATEAAIQRAERAEERQQKLRDDLKGLQDLMSSLGRDDD
jgi:hypothetical protein